MKRINIDDELYADIKEYCELNGLEIKDFIQQLIKDKFMVEKYGDAPPFFKKKTDVEEIVEKVENTIESIQVESQEKEEETNEPEKVEEPIKEKEVSKKEAARKRIQYL